MVADDFVILFISGYIFEDIEFVFKHLPEIDFTMTFFSEQINAINSITIVLLLTYFAQVCNIKDDPNYHNDANRQQAEQLETQF